MTNPVPQNERSTSRVPGTRRLLVIGIAVLVAVGLFIVAFTFGSQLIGLGQPANEAPADPAPATAPDPVELTEFRNDQIGFTLSYPASWVPREGPENQPEDPLVVLRVSDETRENALVVRGGELEQPVGLQELPATGKELTDGLLGSNPTSQLLYEPDALEVAGLPTYRIFLSFKDELSGQQGAHIHYYIFKGKTVLHFIFQTVPLDNLRASAPVFDQIINSLRML